MKIPGMEGMFHFSTCSSGVLVIAAKPLAG
jgi:hypothetical protein